MADPIDDILRREGVATNDLVDRGGRTAFGISESANPEAWADGRVTEEEARAIYEKKYVKGPGFDKIADTQLRAQLIDFGVNSGPMVAIMRLQEILHVDVDGILGNETLAAIAKMHADDICNALVAARVKMIAKIVAKNPSQIKFLAGWINRALEFLK